MVISLSACAVSFFGLFSEAWCRFAGVPIGESESEGIAARRSLRVAERHSVDRGRCFWGCCSGVWLLLPDILEKLYVSREFRFVSFRFVSLRFVSSLLLLNLYFHFDGNQNSNRRIILLSSLKTIPITFLLSFFTLFSPHSFEITQPTCCNTLPPRTYKHLSPSSCLYMSH